MGAKPIDAAPAGLRLLGFRRRRSWASDCGARPPCHSTCCSAGQGQATDLFTARPTWQAEAARKSAVRRAAAAAPSQFSRPRCRRHAASDVAGCRSAGVPSPARRLRRRVCQLHVLAHPRGVGRWQLRGGGKWNGSAPIRSHNKDACSSDNLCTVATDTALRAGAGRSRPPRSPPAPASRCAGWPRRASAPRASAWQACRPGGTSGRPPRRPARPPAAAARCGWPSRQTRRCRRRSARWCRAA